MGETNLTTLSEGGRDALGPPPLYVVRVVAGRDNGRSFVLDWNLRPQALAGKSSVCDLVLTDPRVSRRHLSLSPRGHTVQVTDVGSTNGTFVGGVRVLEAVVSGGEVLDLGDTRIRIVRAGHLTETPEPRGAFQRVLGWSEQMQRIFAMAERLAVSPLPVLVEGESGTGKALLAEALHDAGPRAAGPFMVFDCGTLSPDRELVALFGDAGPGLIEQAAGGTLVLDEVSGLSDAAQARLVILLERGLVQRMSGSTVRAAVRLISTTRRDLDAQVERGAFREALLYRLAAARIELPPLRARTGDVGILARHFWATFGGVGEPPKSFLLQAETHDWPGNVRELEHAVAQRVTAGDEPVALPGRRDVRAGDLVERVLAMQLAMPHARQVVVEEFEERYLARALADHAGNVSRAAAASGVTRRYFHMLLSKKKR